MKHYVENKVVQAVLQDLRADLWIVERHDSP